MRQNDGNHPKADPLQRLKNINFTALATTKLSSALPKPINTAKLTVNFPPTSL
ncbi:MAG: hypothetical protein L3J57_15385 [Desulfuromusa sp.]|nr:hypothetical protein [Desulfuromusa sp.]